LISAFRAPVFSSSILVNTRTENEFDCHVPAIDVAGFAQPFLESGDEMSESGGGPAVEEPNHRHSRLLRARRQRPRCRTAERGYQFPASDGDWHVPLSVLTAY
jgi:hypothetical protein